MTLPKRSVSLSERLYSVLLRLYPADFRREYAPLMAQLFRDQLRAAQCDGQVVPSLWALWGHTLFDLILTIPKEHLLARGVRSAEMLDNTTFDYALNNTLPVWTDMLRSGYSVRQILEALVEQGEEPTVSEFRLLLHDMDSGMDWDTAFQNLATRQPSAATKLFVATLLKQRAEGGNLADRLDELSA